MSDAEILALIRVAIAATVLPFALIARYYILAALLFLAVVAPLLFVLLDDVVWSALAALPMTALLAFHTLDVTRTRHPRGR